MRGTWPSTELDKNRRNALKGKMKELKKRKAEEASSSDSDSDKLKKRKQGKKRENSGSREPDRRTKKKKKKKQRKKKSKKQKKVSDSSDLSSTSDSEPSPKANKNHTKNSVPLDKDQREAKDSPVAADMKNGRITVSDSEPENSEHRGSDTLNTGNERKSDKPDLSGEDDER